MNEENTVLHQYSLEIDKKKVEYVSEYYQLNWPFLHSFWRKYESYFVKREWIWIVINYNDMVMAHLYLRICYELQVV